MDQIGWSGSLMPITTRHRTLNITWNVSPNYHISRFGERWVEKNLLSGSCWFVSGEVNAFSLTRQNFFSLGVVSSHRYQVSKKERRRGQNLHYQNINCFLSVAKHKPKIYRELHEILCIRHSPKIIINSDLH